MVVAHSCLIVTSCPTFVPRLSRLCPLFVSRLSQLIYSRPNHSDRGLMALGTVPWFAPGQSPIELLSHLFLDADLYLGIGVLSFNWPRLTFRGPIYTLS